MKKTFSIFILLIFLLTLASCGNSDFGIGNYEYNYAYIEVENGLFVELEVLRWKDYEDTTVELYLKDGNNILTSLENVILSKEKIEYLTLKTN